LIFALDEIKRDQHIQEGKLICHSKAIYDRNYTKKDIKIVETNIYNFRILKIATHNINRLKANSYKLDILIDYRIEKNIDIIGINETNILEQQSKFLVNKEYRYIGFWTGADRNKIKGLGVSLLISKE